MEKKRLISYITGSLALLCIIFLPGYSEMHKLKEENDRLEKRITFLEQYNDKLRDEMTRMRQDPDYVEIKAREKLGIIKKGEMVYRIEGER